MIVHNDGHTNVICFDALEDMEKVSAENRGFARDKFDLIFTNPPFGAKVKASERPYLSTYTLGKFLDENGNPKKSRGVEVTRKIQGTEVLFIERIWEFLKPATGKAAIVLPDGILNNSSLQYVRNFIFEKFQLLAVVSLPQYAFAHFGAGVKASVIFVRKRGENETPCDDEAVFMAAPEEIGYDATGRENDNSQLPLIIRKFEEFQRDEKPFFF
jgi:type I restriction enzyme M protein